MLSCRTSKRPRSRQSKASSRKAGQRSVWTRRLKTSPKSLNWHRRRQAANAAWKKRNTVAARLAALDKEAGALQAAADAAAKAHADAKWFAGEARSEYEDAHLAFIDATEHTKSVRSSVQAIEKKCKDLETDVHTAEPTAETHHKAVRKRTGI